MPALRKFANIAAVSGRFSSRSEQANVVSVDFYRRHKIDQFTKLSHSVKEAVWHEAESKWKLEIEDMTTIPSTIVKDECDVLVSGAGFLNKWSWPKIQGIEGFSKPKVHSASWDTRLDFKDKTVGLIGNGSSAIQVGSSFPWNVSWLTLSIDRS